MSIKRKVKWILGIILAVLLLLVVLFFALFVSKTPKFEKESNALDSFVTAKILWSVLGDVGNSKNSDELAELTIKRREFMPIVQSIQSNKELIDQFLEKPIKEDVYKIGYKSDEVEVSYIVSKPFLGYCIVAHAKAQLEIKDKEVDLIIKDIKIGRFTLPESACSIIDEVATDIIKEHKNYKDIVDIIKEIDFKDNGDIEIIYYPYRFKEFLNVYDIKL